MSGDKQLTNQVEEAVKKIGNTKSSGKAFGFELMGNNTLTMKNRLRSNQNGVNQLPFENRQQLGTSGIIPVNGKGIIINVAIPLVPTLGGFSRRIAK